MMLSADADLALRSSLKNFLARHNNYPADGIHPTCLDITKLSTTKIDPTGNYVLTTRCRTGRSVRGFRLPPVIDFEERRKLEEAIVNSLLSLQERAS